MLWRCLHGMRYVREIAVGEEKTLIVYGYLMEQGSEPLRNSQFDRYHCSCFFSGGVRRAIILVKMCFTTSHTANPETIGWVWCELSAPSISRLMRNTTVIMFPPSRAGIISPFGQAYGWGGMDLYFYVWQWREPTRWLCDVFSNFCTIMNFN